MKTLHLPIFLFLGACAAHAATTINPLNNFSYGANIGWLNWRGDTNNGAVIGSFTCSGFIWSANVGWIHLGTGTPANGVHYRNNSASDFGVNHDGVGNLTGFAWGANIGWLTFTNRDANGAAYEGPRVDLLTGRLSGFVWSANCGWISLSNSLAAVQTDFIHPGPDKDGDGLPDPWEYQFVKDPSLLDPSVDNDKDGLTNLQEFGLDTDPLKENDGLTIKEFTQDKNGTNWLITWTSRPNRVYRLEKRNALDPLAPWGDAGLPLLRPESGSTTTHVFSDPNSPHRFFRMKAEPPLAP